MIFMTAKIIWIFALSKSKISTARGNLRISTASQKFGEFL